MGQQRHQKIWLRRIEFTVGKNNVKWSPLVDLEKVLMPPHHIKFGLLEQFVKALDNDAATSQHLQSLFPKLSESKVKAGIFVGPQVKKILKSDECMEMLNETEKEAWKSFAAVVNGFLGNHMDDNYAADLVAN